jgi:predicted AAA+ superfamily ATPase
MRRQFTDYLVAWKDSLNRKPLIIRGARQVGKSYIVKKFAQKHFTDIITLNFEEQEELRQVFQTYNTEQIILNLETLFGKKIIANHTLLFFDEVQACPNAIIALRYFYEKHPQLHIIAAGSLLDHALNNMKSSMPVGRVEFAYMYPMSFYEFLWALGENLSVEYLQNYTLKQEIPLAIHNKLLELIRVYYIVGGMPEAVKIYAKSKSILEVHKVHESLIRSLEYDFSKYGTSSQRDIMNRLLNYIPKTIGNKFKYVNFDNSIRSNTIRDALHLMKMSRLIHFIHSSKSSDIPLQYGVNEKVFKLVFLDIGLSNHILKLRLTDISNESIFNEGSLAEQFVGQELFTLPPCYLDHAIYYWTREKRNSEAELDYLLESGRTVIPIEVKAGKIGKLKSLQIYVSEKKIEKAIRFYANPPSAVISETSIKVDKKIQEVKYQLLSLPFYLIREAERLIQELKMKS